MPSAFMLSVIMPMVVSTFLKFAIFSLGDPNHKNYAKVILYDNE